jgi:hypothetical protein
MKDPVTRHASQHLHVLPHHCTQHQSASFSIFYLLRLGLALLQLPQIPAELWRGDRLDENGEER